MATADEYAAWIVKNADQKGTPNFDIVAKAYQAARAGETSKQFTSADIPGYTPFVDPNRQHQQVEPGRVGGNAQPERTWRDDNVAGNLFGPVDAGATMLSSMAAGAVAPAAGFIKSAFNGKDPEKNASDIAESMQYQPRTGTGAQLAGMAGKALAPLGALPTAELTNLGRAVAPAAGVAGNVVRSGAALADDAIAAAPSKLVSIVTPTVSPKVAALAQRAQALGIELRPDMLVDNKFLKIIGDTLEKVPLTGAKAAGRQVAFNRSLIDLIGGDKMAARLTPDIYDAALRKSGAKIGDIADRTPVALDADFSAALESRLQNSRFETDSVGRVVSNYISEITSKADDGIIPGTTFRKLDTQIGKQIRRTSDGDLKHALSQLQDDMQDALQRSTTQGDLADLQGARKQYAIAKTIEPLVAKSPSGDISPAGLMGRVTANNAAKTRMARGQGGELGDIARIGQQFLKEPASSGTAERAAAYSGMAGGAFASLPTTAGIWTGANLYNRLGPRLANSMIGRSVARDAAEAPLIDHAGAANVAAEAQAKSNLAARMAAGRQKKADDIANAGSVTDAVRAFTQPLNLEE